MPNKKIRGDAKLSTVAKKLGVPESVFRNEDGRKTRSDKLLKTMRKESTKK